MAKSNWEFQHDEFECNECERNERYGKLRFYEGTYRGSYAHKYACDNKECRFTEIKTESQMRKEEGI